MSTFLHRVWTALWGVVLFGGVIATLCVVWPPKIPKDWLAIISAVALFVGHLYRHWNWLYLLVQKAWMWLLNTTIYWSFDVELELSDPEAIATDVSDRLEHAIIDCYPAAIRIDRRGSLDFGCRIDRQFSATICVAESEEHVRIRVHVLDMAVGFRDSMRQLRDHLCPLFATVEEQFHISPGGRKYSLLAQFIDGNPYFGVFIQKLNLSNVVNFNLIIKTDQPERRISVSRDNITLVADSLNTFRTYIERTFVLTGGMT